MKKLYYLIILTVILGLVLTGCFLSNVGQVPTNEQSVIAYLTKGVPFFDLVGLWHFDGNTTDSSGNGNDGTVTGATYDSSPMGQALSLDGDDYVMVPDSPLLEPSEITVEAYSSTSGILVGSSSLRLLRQQISGTGNGIMSLGPSTA